MRQELQEISGRSCLDTIGKLVDIGIRVAGTPGEKAAADWIEARFRKLGLAKIQQQEFPCLTFGHKKCELSVREGKKWTMVKSEPAAHSPSTPGAGIEGELAFLENLPASAEACNAKIHGRIVLMYASLLFDWKHFRQVFDCKPKALLLVDDRFHGDWTVGIGFPRYWIDFVNCPVVNVPYQDAWKIVSEGVNSARLRLDAFVREAVSQNVIGEIKGTKWPSESIVISGHHDSVANNPGADDNLTGVAAVLELAKFFVKRPARRTLRFISYGTEEQLSEGARHYAASIKKPEQIQLVLNIDAVGAWMGQTGIYITGPNQLVKLVQGISELADFPGHIKREISPFSDHFPLNLRGVPSVWYYRQTYVAARHFHHSALETIDVLSPRVLETTIRHQAQLLERVANEAPLPYPRKLTALQERKLRTYARDWVGVQTT